MTRLALLDLYNTSAWGPGALPAHMIRTRWAACPGATGQRGSGPGEPGLLTMGLWL
jgi:hypothetical protein